MTEICLMFHEVGLKLNSGFHNSKNYKYVISKSDFFRLLEQSVIFSKKNNVKYSYTFDDGGISNLHSAKVLYKLGLRGVFFIPTNYIGRYGFLTKKHILEIRDMGHEIGTHSHSHPMFLNKFSFENQSNEWLKSIEILEKILNNKIRSASAPNGFYNNDTFKILSNSNVENLYSSIPTNSEKEINHIKLIGRFAIKKNFNNLNIVENNYYTKKTLFIRYQILKYVKKVLPFYWK